MWDACKGEIKRHLIHWEREARRKRADRMRAWTEELLLLQRCIMHLSSNELKRQLDLRQWIQQEDDRIRNQQVRVADLSYGHSPRAARILVARLRQQTAFRHIDKLWDANSNVGCFRS